MSGRLAVWFPLSPLKNWWDWQLEGCQSTGQLPNPKANKTVVVVFKAPDFHSSLSSDLGRLESVESPFIKKKTWGGFWKTPLHWFNKPLSAPPPSSWAPLPWISAFCPSLTFYKAWKVEQSLHWYQPVSAVSSTAYQSAASQLLTCQWGHISLGLAPTYSWFQNPLFFSD